MLDKVIKTTLHYSKPSGQIICNKGAQAEEVLKLLLSHNYEAKDICPKRSKAMIKYNKK